MKREILECDRCGKSAETTEEKKALGLVSIHLGFHISPFSSVPKEPHHSWRKEWCIKCREELGIIEKVIRDPSTPLESIPTLEDMVREIVRDEIQDQL